LLFTSLTRGMLSQPPLGAYIVQSLQPLLDHVKERLQLSFVADGTSCDGLAVTTT
jgi:hypothetical protein